MGQYFKCQLKRHFPNYRPIANTFEFMIFSAEVYNFEFFIAHNSKKYSKRSTYSNFDGDRIYGIAKTDFEIHVILPALY